VVRIRGRRDRHRRGLAWRDGGGLCPARGPGGALPRL